MLVLVKGQMPGAPSYSVLELDAAIKIDLSADVDVTKLPIEQGSPISDHARLEPEEVEIEGLVTDAEVAGSAASGYLALMGLRGVLVSLVGPYEQYDEMTLTRLSVPTSGETGEALHWTGTFRKVTRVQLQQTTVAVKKTVAKKSAGPQSTTAQPQRLRSRWHQAYQSGTNQAVPTTSGGS